MDRMAKKKSAAKRPSMKDVADLAGVSRTTVSFVLNGKSDSNIPPDTQARVLEAVRTLGYRPNLIARNLRGQSTQTIGFVTDLIATTPYAVRILQGAQHRAWEYDKLLITVNTGGDPAMKKAGVNMLLDRQVDGIIFATMYHRVAFPPENIRQVPTVLLDCFVEDRSLPSVVPNEQLGGYTATKYLIDKGHQKIAFLCEAREIPAKIGRLAGYKQALHEAGIPVRDELIEFRKDAVPDSGREMARVIFAKPDHPTAVFCWNDRVALGAYDTLKDLGFSIPNDIAVVGFDNQELVADELRPGLTTISLPHAEMGRWAVDHLMTLINAEKSSEEMNDQPPVQAQLECPLVERASA